MTASLAGILSELPVKKNARRTRSRPQPIDLSDQEQSEIADRVVKFFDDDDDSRSSDLNMRMQRYAKMMQYTTESDAAFDGASNMQLSDIMAAVLRTEDTLQNSAMSTRPMVNSQAKSEDDKERERKIDLLLDTQFFTEQDGEALVEQMTMNFVRDGFFVALTRWVRDLRKTLTARTFESIPVGLPPIHHFRSILADAFDPAMYVPDDPEDGWDWTVTQGKQEFYVHFYVEEEGGDVTMVTEAQIEAYCGPRVRVYDYEDVLAPAWSLNLQPPGPANPDGAPHVILVDYPTKDEILKGIEVGLYDLVEASDIEGIDTYRDWTNGDRELDRQRRNMRGVDVDGGKGQPIDPDHIQLKRLTCFDLWKGLDVVWTVLVASKNYLLRARPLTEYSPGVPPRRPLAHAAMIPIQGTWMGMGLPELMEGWHDYLSATLNQMYDSATYEMVPFFTYRQSSNLKPEDIRISPGRGIPVQNVATDLAFQRANPQATQVGVNLMTIGEDFEEKLTSLGDLQVGRIPTGKSAALRTSSGIQQVLAQGEARPERILRRFFKGIRDVYRSMYQLDQHFLPEKKQFRVIGVSRPEEDPFLKVDRTADLKDFYFDFQANVLNSSKLALQQALDDTLTTAINPLLIQLGVTTPDSIYRILCDRSRAQGQNPEKYWNRPKPDSAQAPIYAEDAVQSILHGLLPQGPPAEGDFQAHLARVQELVSTPDPMGVSLMDLFTDSQKQQLGLYIQSVQQAAVQAQEQAQMMAAAGQMAAQRQQQGSEGQQGGPPPPQRPGPVQRNDVMNESLPASGTPQ